MKKAIKYILVHIISLCYLLIWFLRQLVHEDFKNYIPQTRQNKPIIILGNGPSLIDLINSPHFIKTRNDNHFCTVNFSILSPLFQQLKPEYLTLADPLFFQRPIINEKFQLFMDELQKINWKISLIIPFIYYKQMKAELGNHPYVTIMPIHTNILNKQITSTSLRNYIYKKGLSCPRIQNVVIASVYSMINLGYNKILLFGVDHSWTTQLCVNTENQVCLKDEHYYDKDKAELKPWLKGTGEPYKMHEVLRDLAHMFDSYHELQAYANHCGRINIINMSKHSFIDAFKKA